MDKSLVVGLVICILLFFLVLNFEDFYNGLSTPYGLSNLYSTLCCALIP